MYPRSTRGDSAIHHLLSDAAKLFITDGVDFRLYVHHHPCLSPLTQQGKIERWHQTLKNRILLENYYLPCHLEQKTGDFVSYYNHLRYYESISNLIPADVYFGRRHTILLEREGIKRDNINTPRLQHRCKAAQHQIQMRQILSSITPPIVSTYLTTDNHGMVDSVTINYTGVGVFIGVGIRSLLVVLAVVVFFGIIFLALGNIRTVPRRTAQRLRETNIVQGL